MVRGECETILNSSGDTFLPPPRFSKAPQPPSARAPRAARPAGIRIVRRIVLPSVFSSCPLIMAASGRALSFADEGIDEHQADADNDRRIGDIERRPVPMANVEISKIEHRSPP